MDKYIDKKLKKAVGDGTKKELNEEIKTAIHEMIKIYQGKRRKEE